MEAYNTPDSRTVNKNVGTQPNRTLVQVQIQLYTHMRTME